MCCDRVKTGGIGWGLGRIIDCAVVNTSCEYFAGIGRAFDTVRGAFPEGDPVFADSKILTMTHVQICVRNPEAVVAYFLPR